MYRRQHQQAADHHQQEIDCLDAHHRRKALQRAVNLAVAKLQPREAGQHPAAQELGDLPHYRRGDGHADGAGTRPEAGEDASEQTGIERQVGRQQHHEEDVDRPRHTAKLGDADVDPVNAGAKEAESPRVANCRRLQRAAVKRQPL